jgi:hypothetical protein
MVSLLKRVWGNALNVPSSLAGRLDITGLGVAYLLSSILLSIEAYGHFSCLPLAYAIAR